MGSGLQVGRCGVGAGRRRVWTLHPSAAPSMGAPKAATESMVGREGGGGRGGGAQDDVRVHAGGAVVRGGIDAVAVATASAMESRRSRTTSMAEARSQACSDRGQVRRCWAAGSCGERLRARGADHTVSAAHSAGGTHDPVSRDHDAPLDGMATRRCPLLRRKCYESDRRQKEERTEGRRKDGAGLDMRLSREAASLLARHRLASIGGRVERLHACWLGTGWPRKAAESRGCMLAG